MLKIDRVLDSFINGDYFLVFLALILIILVVLIISLIKSKEDYNDLLGEKEKSDYLEDYSYEDDLLSDFENLKAKDENDVIDEDTPLVKQIDVPGVKTYNDVIDEYESSEEENAVISASELEKRTKDRMDRLGTNDNQVAIEKYEEEQEKKAIISYEQLLKNASNITLSYVDDTPKGDSAPKVNKIEVEQKEVVGEENYLSEEEFLKILKEFRLTL